MPIISKKTTYLVIPAFNEEKRISQVLNKAKRYGHPIVVVDDGSTDKTCETAKGTFGVIVLRHKINLGKGAALKTGVEAAFSLGAQAVIALDADGQHDPKSIADFYNQLSLGNDIVFGYRKLAGKAPIVRFAGNRLGAVVVKLLFGIYRNDLLCGYLAFTKRVYSKIHWESTRYGLETEIVARVGKNKLKYSEVEIETIYIDKYKGVSIIDAIGILPSVLKWRFIN